MRTRRATLIGVVWTEPARFRYRGKVPPTIDVDLMHFFNQAGPPWLDRVMITVSSPFFLLGIGLCASLYLALRSPHGVLAAVLLWVAIGSADLLSVRVIKRAVGRERPCQSAAMVVRTPVGCGSGRSFPSTHATEVAAAAAVLSWGSPALSPAAILLALTVGVSRIYLGVHFATDVLAGFILGAAMGAAWITLARLRFV